MAERCSCCDTELSEAISREVGVCDVCRTRLGIVPLGPSTRPPAPCMRCNGLVFVRAVPREHAGEVNTAAPMVVTHRVRMAASWRGDNYTKRVTHDEAGVGRLEMYICRGCGFVEWYVDDPAALPIGAQYMTELVDHGSKGPYR